MNPTDVRTGRWRAVLVFLCLAFWTCVASATERVVVLTSYPQEVFAAFEAAFERANPDVDASRDAYSLPAPGLPEARRDAFFRGRNLFRQVWIAAPSPDQAVDGLGPVFNRQSCIACHARNGRGFAPDGPAEEMRAMLVRLSLPGSGPHGAPIPVPAYGDQLNDGAIPGVPREGRAAVSYSYRLVSLSGGETVQLRRQEIGFRDLGLTSALYPHENCALVQSACRSAPDGGSPVLSETQLDDLVT